MLKLFKILGVFLLTIVAVPVILLALFILPFLSTVILSNLGITSLPVLFTVSIIIILAEVVAILYTVETWGEA